MLEQPLSHHEKYPDTHGFFGNFGGSYYPKELKPALEELSRAHATAKKSSDFQQTLDRVRIGLQGRPTPLHFLENISNQIGGARIYVKREDLNHTGAHKINHCVGFALLAKRMNKSKLIAETGAGQHGVALATAAAYFGLECEVHMGEIDIQKASSNVGRMRLLGAKVVSVSDGQSALKDASDSAFNAYMKQHDRALYAIGSAIGPHPFPVIVRDFQSIIGQEARRQFHELCESALPDHVVACVAGGSNAMGIYSAFIDDPEVALHAVEPLGKSDQLGQHAATLSFGRAGTLHGARSIVLQSEANDPALVSSVASGLVYPGVGPEIAMLFEQQRLSVASVPDDQAIDAFFRVTSSEGIVPALESAHALAFAMQLAKKRPTAERILVNLSGRGDKDVDFILSEYGLPEEAAAPLPVG